MKHTLVDGREGEIGTCRGCGTSVAFVYNPKTHKTPPYNLEPSADGRAVSHFATCPMAAQFKGTARPRSV